MIYPKHVALIPDGNRTWAKEKGLPQMLGHIEGFKRGNEIIHYIFTKTPIQVFTGWGLSTENLTNRTPEELEYLFNLYKQLTSDLEGFMRENSINFKWVGSEKGLPDHLIEYLRGMESRLNFDTDRYVALCVNYGGRDEILRGVKNFFINIKETDSTLEEQVESLDEKEFAKYLDFGNIPNVDLVIRTKGDKAKRLSGFMLWWIGYAELFFSPLKCPDFTVEEFEKSLQRFDEISEARNFGK